jgi:hypothetical protein
MGGGEVADGCLSEVLAPEHLAPLPPRFFLLRHIPLPPGTPDLTPACTLPRTPHPPLSAAARLHLYCVDPLSYPPSLLF